MLLNVNFVFLIGGALKSTLLGLDDTVTVVTTLTYESSNIVAAGCRSGMVIIWDCNTDEAVHTVSIHTKRVISITASGN